MYREEVFFPIFPPPVDPVVSAILPELLYSEIFPVPVYFALDYWSLENGYKNKSENLYPRRVFQSGLGSGLKVSLKQFKEDLDFKCRKTQGFKVILHTPAELPTIFKNFFRLQSNEELMIAVQPQIMKTKQNLKRYSPEYRQCFFNNERYLRYFKVYTQSNCELECFANQTLAKCGCVAFYMPRNANTRVCRFPWKCFIGSLTASNKIDREISKCNCLPLCSSITFDAEITQSRLENQNSRLFKQRKELFECSQLSIFYKESQFVTFKRTELYGPIDLIANCGGLFGLFMGISLLSFGELLYFCIVRVFVNLKMKKRNLEDEADAVILKSCSHKITSV